MAVEMKIKSILIEADGWLAVIDKLDDIMKEIKIKLEELAENRLKQRIPVEEIHDSLPLPNAETEIRVLKKYICARVDSAQVLKKVTKVHNIAEIKEIGIRYCEFDQVIDY